MDWVDKYRLWLEKTAENDELHRELERIADDNTAIEDRFYRELTFGTGGLRGVLGAGTNRMNVYTVAKATQGLANYLKHEFQCPSVAIAYDSRIHSDLFARTAAEVFSANGIMVYIYPHLMPTPSLSFAVRNLGCSGGVVVTASHNPARYNGYKVYGSDGCQITTEAAKAIQCEIDAVDMFSDVRLTAFSDALDNGTIRYIGEDTIESYLSAIATASVLPKDYSRNVSIVYTPLNGAGISCVPRCLREHGFTKIILVEEQKNPDGNFPTCPFPNPEIREALELGLKWAKKTDSDLLLATDPDCDRVGTAVRDGNSYMLINGNEMGVLLLDFICKMRISSGTMPKCPVAVKTIVTTPMAARIANHYGIELRDVLTGFKYIGEQIGFLEKNGEAERYIFGFEESYGYLSGSFVRDKDAVNASLLICEMFAYYKAQGKTLIDVLNDLYQHFGFYETRLLNFVFEGVSGFKKMQELMDSLRKQTQGEIGGIAVQHVKDYAGGIDGLPQSNVLRFFLEKGMEAVVRPSGTEPKLKVYLTTTGETKACCAEAAEQLGGWFQTWAAT